MTNKELAKIVGEQNEKIKELAEMMSMLVEVMPRKVEVPATTMSSVPLGTVNLPPEVRNGLPPPSQWRMKVTELLGEDFDLQVEETSGGNYIMKVYLPEKYDRRVGEKQQGRDLSTGLVRRASDVADVEKWCNLIKLNIQKYYPDFKK